MKDVEESQEVVSIPMQTPVGTTDQATLDALVDKVARIYGVSRDHLKVEVVNGLVKIYGKPNLSDLEQNVVEHSALIIQAAERVKQQMKDDLGKSRKLRVYKQRPIVNDRRKIGRNERCPCQSGKKFKQCCLKSVPADLDPITNLMG